MCVTQETLFDQFVQIINKKKGVLKISELEKLAGYSSRYINIIFEKHGGMSAKKYCNMVKMNFVIDEMKVNNFESFAKLASKYKFYDQAHFIHEFKDFTGKTPSEYKISL